MTKRHKNLKVKINIELTIQKMERVVYSKYKITRGFKGALGFYYNKDEKEITFSYFWWKYHIYLIVSI